MASLEAERVWSNMKNKNNSENDKRNRQWEKENAVAYSSKKLWLRGHRAGLLKSMKILAEEYDKIQTFIDLDSAIYKEEFKGALALIESLHKKFLKDFYVTEGQLWNNKIEFEKLWQEYLNKLSLTEIKGQRVEDHKYLITEP